VALVASFAIAKDEINPIQKRAEMQAKIDALRAEGKVKGWTFTVGVNPAMQYTLDQLCNFKPDLEPYNSGNDHLKLTKKQPWLSPTPTPVPTNTPTQTYYEGYWTAIRNQGSCGSCWAFGTIGAFESNLKKNGITTDLSEQWLVSCNNEGWGCNGGFFAEAYMISPGAVLESCYPYTATDSACVTGCPFVYSASDAGRTGDDVASIKWGIVNYGAVGAAVYVNTAFQAYTSGTFNGCADRSCNHAIVLCGWDDSKGANGAWLLKNSWGTGWGEDGFMWIEYGCSRVGYSATYVEY
jgi:hypothetical protein